MAKAPVIVFSHGGGPLPVLGDPSHDQIVHSLRNRVPSILRLNTPDRPCAIVLITAHWSERRPTISSGASHGLLYDYYGFPPESYSLKYPAPGSPEVAHEVAAAMRDEGLNPVLDSERGWDHGVFIPCSIAIPKADIPIVQLSVIDNEDAIEHYKMGRALAKLREHNVSIVGSGFATLHNLRTMISGAMALPEFRKRNDEWSQALTRAVSESDPEAREEMLAEWRTFPHAYEMHPHGGAEHFLSLIVAAGAGGEGKAKHYKDDYKGVDMFSYYWE